MQRFAKPRPTQTGLAAITLSLLVLGMTPAPVHAQSLVKDGDFEQADLGAAPGAEDAFNSLNPFDLSWTITQGTAGVDTQNLYVFDGKKSLYLNEDPSGVTTTITQNLATTVGQNYTVSFYADQSAGSTGSLTVMFGGATFSTVVPANGYSGPPPGNNGSFTFYTGIVTATSALTPLTFSSAAPADHGGLTLDDISVTPAPVPEASSAVSMGLLLALGMGGFIVAARKKRPAQHNPFATHSHL